MSRPSKHTKEFATLVAKEMWEDVKNWWGKDIEREYEDDIFDQLVKVLKNNNDWEGYELAKDLEDQHYWRSDSLLVDIMDNAGVIGVEIHNAQLEAWVKENNLVSPFQIGDKVKISGKNTNYWWPKLVGKVGEIVTIYPNRAAVGVKFDPNENGWRLIDYEFLVKAE